MPRNAVLNLAIGLPIRNSSELDALLARLSDIGSDDYRRYLSPEQFADRFGPTQHDYDALINFVRSRGLKIVATYPNRTLLDVSGTATDVENTFDIHLMEYQHRSRGKFFAPDREPKTDAPISILDISGLDNFGLPRPMSLYATPMAQMTPFNSGSGPAKLLLGADFRKAYAPDVTLTGAGQAVGLFEMDGFYQSDITANFKQAGMASIPTQTILINGFSGNPGANSGEPTLDVMMAAYMAPGLSKIVVYEGNTPNDILNRMATDLVARQLSSSWGFAANATTEQIFKQFIAQGQTFLQASGDGGAYVGSIMSPCDNPNVTSVGGTTLTTSGSGGPWQSETAWRGSGGGISGTYAIPDYQVGLNMGANRGSTTFRNIPDVAAVADVQIFLIKNNGQAFAVGGTSAAAPLWAGLAAVANQQAALNSKGPIGFLNPIIYGIGKTAKAAADIHDITLGDNTGFAAVSGYDLATGWGSPMGQSLINDLAGATSTASSVVTSSPVGLSLMVDGAACTTPCSFTWPSGSTHIVSAGTQAAGVGGQYVWTTWSDGLGSSHSVTSTAPTTYTATFTKQYQLTSSASPASGGTISPATGWYNAGSVVSVSATPATGYQFTNFAGALSGTTSPQSVTMSGPVSVTASFAPSSSLAVTVTSVPTGLSLVVDGAECASPCTFSWSSGSTHTVSGATQTGGTGVQYVWAAWSDGLGASHSVTPTSPITYTATFTKQYQLTSAASPTAGGTISPESGWYNAGAAVAVSARPAAGYQFLGFSGALSGTTPLQTVTMSGPLSITATFGLSSLAVTVTSVPTGISLIVDGAVCTSPCVFSWSSGSTHSLLAATQPGGTGVQYVWTAWSDGLGASHSVTPAVPTTYTASFTKQYQLTTAASPASGGTITPGSGWYNAGAVAAVSATPAAGFQFSGFSGTISGTVSPQTVTMSGPVSLTATFTAVAATASLAQGKTATQSSTYSGYAAALAVDGNTSGVASQGSVSMTNVETSPWWQVDLGSSAIIDSIVIWGRTDCCGSLLNDYWIFVSDKPFKATDTISSLQNRAGTWNQATSPSPSAVISAGGAQGRYVRVQVWGKNNLAMAEVQVFGSWLNANKPATLNDIGLHWH